MADMYGRINRNECEARRLYQEHFAVQNLIVKYFLPLINGFEKVIR